MELSKEQQKIISKLPKGEYKVEIIGMHNRPLTAKEIKENYQRWLKQRDFEEKQKMVQSAISIGKEERLGDNGKEARN